jgi:hypothetical protein
MTDDLDRKLDAHFPPPRHCAVVQLHPAQPADTVPVQYRGCNGNCMQGRACDCVDNIDEREPISSSDRAWIVAAATASAALVCLALWLALR